MSLAHSIFKKYDKDGSGFISGEEFKSLCYELGHCLSDQEISIAVKLIDKNGNGKIEFNEFMEWWKTNDRFGKLKLDEKQLESLNRASNYFKFFDKDGTGSLSVEEFKLLYADLVKNKFTTKTLESCLEDLDSNRDGKVQFNEYIDWLIRLGSIPIKVIFK